MHFLCWSWKYFSFITDSICLCNFLYICFFFGKQPNFFGQVVKNLDFGHIILSRIVVSWCRSQFVICLEANYYQYYNSKYFYYIAGRFVEGLKWNLTPRLFFLRNTNTPMYQSCSKRFRNTIYEIYIFMMHNWYSRDSTSDILSWIMSRSDLLNL